MKALQLQLQSKQPETSIHEQESVPAPSTEILDKLVLELQQQATEHSAFNAKVHKIVKELRQQLATKDAELQAAHQNNQAAIDQSPDHALKHVQQ